jgi:hypothetical protein
MAKVIRCFFAVALSMLLALPVPAMESDGSYDVTYAGGSIPGVKQGDHMDFCFTKKGIVLMRNMNILETIPVKAITAISYGQDGHFRALSGTLIGLTAGVLTLGLATPIMIPIMMSRSKKHYVALSWNDGKDLEGGVALRVDKNDFRGLLAALSGVSGHRVSNEVVGQLDF